MREIKGDHQKSKRHKDTKRKEQIRQVNKRQEQKGKITALVAGAEFGDLGSSIFGGSLAGYALFEKQQSTKSLVSQKRERQAQRTVRTLKTINNVSFVLLSGVVVFCITRLLRAL